MENILQKSLRLALGRQLSFHERHEYQVSKILKGIEPEYGILSGDLIKECDDYAVDILGDKKYAPWLYVYSAIAGQFKQGWIPDNFYGAQVVPNINGHYGTCASLKPLNSTFFHAKEFPDLGSFVNGLFLDRDYKVHSEKSFINYLFLNCDRIVFKTDKSLKGNGIHFFDQSSFNVEYIKPLGNGVFQSLVEQHSLFDEFAPESVATIRLTTAINDEGEVSVRGSHLRLGTASDTHVKSATEVRVPINSATGKLDKTGYMPSYLTIRSHPTSQKSFDNVTIPDFEKCIDAVTSLHLSVPYVRCIGWDVTLDKAGEVVILEWNGGHNGIKFTEATNGPSFSDLNWERFR